MRVTDELSVSLAISITSPLPLPMSSHQTALPSLTHYYQFLGFTETTFFQCDVLHNRQIIHTHHTHIGESTLSKRCLFQTIPLLDSLDSSSLPLPNSLDSSSLLLHAGEGRSGVDASSVLEATFAFTCLGLFFRM